MIITQWLLLCPNWHFHLRNEKYFAAYTILINRSHIRLTVAVLKQTKKQTSDEFELFRPLLVNSINCITFVEISHLSPYISPFSILVVFVLQEIINVCISFIEDSRTTEMKIILNNYFFFPLSFLTSFYSLKTFHYWRLHVLSLWVFQKLINSCEQMTWNILIELEPLFLYPCSVRL